MARMNGTETIIASATSTSISLRSTIPVFVVSQMGLKEGDHLNWKVGKKWNSQNNKDVKINVHE